MIPVAADWDTCPDEALFLATAVTWLDGFGVRDHTSLIRLLSLGVDESWFLDPNHRTVYSALVTAALDLSKPGVTVRIGAVIAEAEHQSGETGWVRPLLSRITDDLPTLDLDNLTTQVIPRWWQKLKRKAVSDCIGAVAQDFYLPPTADRFAAIDTRLVEALDRWRAEPDLQALTQAPFDAFLAGLKLPRPQDSFVSTGIRALDDALTGGLSGPGASAPGKVIVVCARPGAGKTMLVGTLSMHVANAGYPVAFFSFEMGVEQLVARITAARHLIESGWQPGMPFQSLEHVTYRQLISREWSGLSQQAYDRIFDGGHLRIQDNLTIYTKALKAEALAQQMRLHKQRHPNVRLMVVDHLGLLDMPGDNRAVAVGEASRIIKVTAIELGVDVVLVSQLNRAVENRQSKMPSMADLRDSGAIEQDADVILGIYRPGYYDSSADPTLIEIGVLKNRQGGTGVFTACIKLDYCLVRDRE